MTVTEIGTLPLIAGADITDTSSDAGKAWASAFEIIARQPGYDTHWYGLEVENPSIAQIFINWETHQAHLDFMAADDYKPMLAHLGSLLAGAPDIYHAALASYPAQKQAFGAPVTECITFHTASKSETFEASLQEFVGIIGQHAEGFLGAAHGWSVEDVAHEKLGEGVEGKVLFVAIGWASLKAHADFRGTPHFQENIGKLRNPEIVKAQELHHVKMLAA